MQSLLQKMKNQVIVMDGAMGSYLLSQGFSLDTPLELLNVTRPEVIQKIHQEYQEAGAEILFTNTFGASRNRLSSFADQIKEINQKGVWLARQAAKGKAWVAGDIGPIGTRAKPFTKMTRLEAKRIFQEQAELLIKTGVDLIAVETQTSHAEMMTALEAITEVIPQDLPLMISMTLSEQGFLPSKEDPLISAAALAKKGVQIIGLNCSYGPESLFSVFKTFKKKTNLPIAIKPNAGLPDSHGLYSETPQSFTQWGKRFKENGANLIGGCCGTTPKYIQLITSL